MTFIKGLMMFNQRVIHFGKVNFNDDMEKLKDRIFFNKIFINNINELFQKYDCRSIFKDYTKYLNEYIKNISMIRGRIQQLDPTILFEDKPSFEKRLGVERNIANQIITEYYPVGNIPKFLDNVIYYITPIKDEYIAVSYIDPRKSIYDKIVSFKFNGYTSCFKTDKCIQEYLEEKFSNKTVVLKVVKLVKDSQVTKVECYGDIGVIKSITWMFPQALILENKYLYIDDIDKLISSKCKTKAKRVPFIPDFDMYSIFEKDLLVEYPTSPFGSYLQLLKAAATDHRVKGIMMTLYRVGDDPSIYYILAEARRRGITVHVNVELDASGEEINKFWLKELEMIGVIVTWLGNGFKVHTKLTLIDFLGGKRIAQIGTGNYHSQTTTQYTDLSLMTSDIDICRQVNDVFSILRSEHIKHFNSNVLVTRYNARNTLFELINREGDKGKDGYIAFKCNALDDHMMNDALEEAASKGCKIDLVIRGVCTWIPKNNLGINVLIKSVVWDKLEHSRVYCFGKHNPTIYIGSLDLVTSKLDYRIETLVRVHDHGIINDLTSYLNRYIINTRNSWIMIENGEYVKE